MKPGNLYGKIFGPKGIVAGPSAHMTKHQFHEARKILRRSDQDAKRANRLIGRVIEIQLGDRWARYEVVDVDKGEDVAHVRHLPIGDAEQSDAVERWMTKQVEPDPQVPGGVVHHVSLPQLKELLCSTNESKDQ